MVVSFFKSPFLQKLEQTILSSLTSSKPFTITADGETRELTEEEMTELRSYFLSSNQVLARKTLVSPIIAQQDQEKKNFEAEIQRTLFRSINPADWQIDGLLGTLDIFLNWKKEDKKKQWIIRFEPHIRKAIISLRKRKAELEEEMGWKEIF